MERIMPADKLGRYMTSDVFLARANAAVKKAVRNLEEKGIEPAYVVREPKEAATQVSGNVVKVSVGASSAKRTILKVA
jgi:CBS domain-containing protein